MSDGRETVAAPPPPPPHLRRPTPPAAGTSELLAQLRALGLQDRRSSSGGKERSYVGLAANRSNSGRWRPAAGPDSDTAAAAGQNGQQQHAPSAYFAAGAAATAGTPPASRTAVAAAAAAAVMTPDDTPATAARTPLLDGAAAGGRSGPDDDDALLFHMTGLKERGAARTPPLARSLSMPQAGQHPSPLAVQRSFGFTPEPEPSPRGLAAAPVPTHRTPPSSRPASRNVLPPAAAAAVASAALGPHSRSSSRRVQAGRPSSRGSAERAAAAVAAAQPPAWSEELLSWMLTEKAELLVQLQRAERERADLASELERARNSRAADDGEVTRLQAERRALLDRVQQLSRAEAEASAALERLRMENDALAAELAHSQDVCKEMLAARRAARDALSEMSAQNARLVAAYVERKAEAGALREALRRQEQDAQGHIQELEAQLEDARAQLAGRQQEQQASEGVASAALPGGSPSGSTLRSQRPAEEEPELQPEPASPSSDEWQSPAPARCGTGRQQGGKENEAAAGNSAAKATEAPAGKAGWDSERSELLSLLERLQEQLAVHAGQPEAEQEEEYEVPGTAQRSTTPYAPPSEGEEGSPPAAAYDSPEQQRQRQAQGPHSPSSLRAAANLVASFAEAAAVGGTSGASSEAGGPSDSSCKPADPPAMTEHQLHGTPASPLQPCSRESAPSPPSARPPIETPLSCPRSNAPGSGMRLSPFTSPAATSKQRCRAAAIAGSPQQATEAAAGSPPAQQVETVVQQAAQPAPAAAAEREEQRHKAELHKAAGNLAFQQRQHERAAQEYTRGLQVLGCSPGGEGEAGGGSASAHDARLAAVLLCNRAAALQAGGRHVEALADAFRAEAADPSYLRTYQRRADAYIALGAFAPALADLERAVELGGGHEAASRLREVARAAAFQPPPCHYTVLGLPPGAAPAEVKSAYRRLALQFHPDKAGKRGGGAALPPAAAEHIFKLVTEAHSVLSDPERRRAHDILALRFKYRRAY